MFKRRVEIWIAVAFLVVLLNGGWAVAKRDYGPHSGYLENTKNERDTSYTDLLLPPPPVSSSRDFGGKIFNPKLTREFRDRYEERFGRTEEERIYNSPNRFTYFADIHGFTGTPQEKDDEKRRYGEFVMRRLFEYHLDNYAQNDPKLRPAWEAKERIKEFRVEVAQFRFDAQYSIAGNTFDVRMANPYLNLLRVRLQMDPGKFGPAPVVETTVSVARALTSTISVETHYQVFDQTIVVIERKGFTSNLGGSLTQSTYVANSGISPRESKYLAGLAYVF
jgi:hypothetical protein